MGKLIKDKLVDPNKVKISKRTMINLIPRDLLDT